MDELDQRILAAAADIHTEGYRPTEARVAKRLGYKTSSTIGYRIKRLYWADSWPYEFRGNTAKKVVPRIYMTWQNMKGRCYDLKDIGYRFYGAKGIGVCAEWRDNFQAFETWARANGYDDTLTLERDDVTRDYGPDNCKWIPRSQQQKNKSTTRRITMFGETKCREDWANDPRCAVTPKGFKSRIQYGWHPEDAFITPKRQMPDKIIEGRKLIAAQAEIEASFTETEAWEPIPDCPGYEASDWGRIRSFLKVVRKGVSRKGPFQTIIGDTPKILRLNYIKGVRPSVMVYRDGISTRLLVGRLILLAHVGPPPLPEMEVCHFPDPSPANCRLNNIRWGTRSDNLRDKTRTRQLARRMIDLTD